MPRWFALARLSRRRLGELFGARAGRAYGVGIAVSHALLILLLPKTTEASAVTELLKSGLVSASWAVAGFVSLSAARDLAARDDGDGLTELAATRGYDSRDLTLARFGAAAFVIAFWIFVPFTLLALLAAFRSSIAGAVWALGWIGFVAFYVAILALTTSALARIAARLYPSHGRSALGAFVLLPHLLHSAFPAVPSLPAAFGWLLEHGTGWLSVAS